MISVMNQKFAVTACVLAGLTLCGVPAFGRDAPVPVDATVQAAPPPPPPPPPPLIPGESLDELADQVGDLCFKMDGVEGVIKLDPYARTAIYDRLRLGLYRETLNLVFKYLSCYDRVRISGTGYDRLESSLRDLACTMPAVIFQNEGKIDRDLAARALTACGAPATEPGKGSEEVAAWASAVRRYLTLAAIVMEPAEFVRKGLTYTVPMGRLWDSPIPLKGQVVPTDWRPADLRHAIKSTEAMLKRQLGAVVAAGTDAVPAGGAAAGVGPAVDVVAEGGAAGVRLDPGAADLGLYVAPKPEVPRDVAEARLLVIAAAVAIGDIESAIQAAGGQDMGCRYGTDALVNILEPGEDGPTGFLPMVVLPIIRTAELDAMVRAVKTGSNRLGPQCALVSLAAALAVKVMTVDSLPSDRLAQSRLASVVANAPVERHLAGDPAIRIELLQDVVGQLDSRPADRGYRLHELGLAMIDAGRADEAADIFTRSFRDLPEVARVKAFEGKFLVALNDAGSNLEDMSLAARNLADAAPSVDSLIALAAGIPTGQERTLALETLFNGATASTADAVSSMVQLLVHVLDTWPGTAEAAMAISLMERQGVQESDPDALASWLLLVGRHYIVAGDTKAAWVALDRAVTVIAGGKAPDARDASLPRLVYWLIESGRSDLAVTLGTRAAKAGAVSAAHLVAASRLAGEKGKPRQAAALFASGTSMKKMDLSDWLAVASVSLRARNLVQTGKAVEKMGLAQGWGYNERMVRGRYLFLKRQYAAAIDDFNKAVELKPDVCEPYLYRGIALVISGNAAGGESDFWNCLNMEPPSPRVLGALAFAMFDQNRFSEAAGIFGRALNLEPDNADNLIGLAISAFRAGDLDAARAAFGYAVGYTPVFGKGPDAAEAAGYAYSKLEKQAWGDLRKTLEEEKKAAARASRRKK